jgi:hypothetical protein
MRKDDRGLTPQGGTLVDDVVNDTAAMSPASPSSGESRPSAGDTTATAASQPDGPAATDSALGAPPAPGQAGRGDASAPPGKAGPEGANAAGPADGKPADGPAAGDADARASVGFRPSGRVARMATDTPEPSWGKVLATTISLWVSRRLRRIGIGRRTAGPSYGAPTAGSRGLSTRRWRVVALVLAAAVLALVGLQVSGALNNGATSPRPAAQASGSGTSSLSAPAAARDQAAAWVAQQVSSADIVACDPAVCSELAAHGLPAGRLLPLQPGASPFGADVIVASPSVRSEFGSQLTEEYAPALIASFGSGAARVDIRAIASLGGAAYRAAEPPDLAARKAAGAQLLHNPRFHATAQAASQMTAGQVDSRLLVTLASLVSQRSVSVASFGDTGPGAPVLYRQVTLDSPGGEVGDLTADLDQVHTQRNPYLPASAIIVHLGAQAQLRIEFGAPNLPGLLSGGNS